jgi:hypothetical protein
MESEDHGARGSFDLFVSRLLLPFVVVLLLLFFASCGFVF